jgi:hypothetical protein
VVVWCGALWVVGTVRGLWWPDAICASLSLSARSLFYHFAPTLFLEAKDWHTGRRQAGQGSSLLFLLIMLYFEPCSSRQVLHGNLSSNPESMAWRMEWMAMISPPKCRPLKDYLLLRNMEGKGGGGGGGGKT